MAAIPYINSGIIKTDDINCAAASAERLSFVKYACFAIAGNKERKLNNPKSMAKKSVCSSLIPVLICLFITLRGL